MSTVEDINKVLSGQSATLGWDALVAYNRDRVNTLLHQQYIEKVRAGEHYSPFSHESDTTATGYHFKNLVLGPPLISFENANIENSKASVRMMFIDGSFIRTDSDGQVVQWDRYTPVSKYGLNITVELQSGSGDGNVSTDGKVTIDLTKGVIYEIEGLNGLSADVVLAFQNFLKNNPMTYTLGELKSDDTQETLYPEEFVVRTQKYPGSSALASSSNADGAVLVFIKIKNGSRGTLPSKNDSQPWVIPEGKSATLLISDKLLYGQLLADSFKSRIKDFDYKTTEADGKYALEFTKGYVPTTNVIYGTYAGIEYRSWLWSSDSTEESGHRPARLSMADFVFSKGSDNKTIHGYFKEEEFTETFHINSAHTGGSTDDVLERVSIKRGGSLTATLTLNKDSDVIFESNVDFSLTSNNKTFLEFGDRPIENFVSEASNNLNKTGFFSLDSIKTFYLSNILFPGDNILSFSEVYNPGDLALYGDIAQSLTTLIITPGESVIGCGQTLQFSASLGDGSVPQELVWSVDGVGSIDSNGLYTAPATGEITQTKNAIITATTSGGLKSIAIATVLVSALDVEPAFILVKEKAMSTIQFTAYQAGSAQQEVAWTLDADVSDAGSLDNNGVYTPPAGQYDTDEPIVISAVASLPSGEQSRAIICLWGKEIEMAFPATPAYTLNVTENSTNNFSTQNRRADADGWQLYPQSGKLTDPRKKESADKMHIWECDYLAPKGINRPELVFIKITEEEPAGYAGYALVELQPPVSPWSRVTGLSTLSISTVGSSAAGAEIYGNGLNQATMQINISAQDEENNNVNVLAQDIIPYITLVDYSTGEELANAGVWAYTDKINDYNTSPTALQSGTNVISLYVSANQGALTKDIAVKVQLVNSAAQYKYASTAKDSDSGHDSKVTVRTLQPINYSDKENIKYGSDAPVKIKDNLRFTVITGDSYVSKSTGECYQCLVEIAPANQDGSGFKTVIMDYNPVINETVNTETQSWGGIKNELSFSCLPYDKLRKSCSVAGYHAGSGSADDPALKSSAMIYFDAKQFEGKNTPGLEGVIYFHNGDIKYRLEVINIKPSSSDGSSIVFVGYLFKIPEAEVNPLGWKSSLNPVRVMVTDIYGNSGSITLRWDDHEHYVTPAII